MVGSTGTIQNDGSLKIKKWWSEKKRLLKGTNLQRQEENILGQHKWLRGYKYWKFGMFNDKTKAIQHP
jgi:hypothetical protein